MAMKLKNCTLGELLQLILLLITIHYRVGEAVNSEGIVLQAFKQRLDDPLGALSNWNDSDTTPCKWKGVVCQNLTIVVIFMYANESFNQFATKLLALELSCNLPFKSLSGVIAPQLAELKHLERLSLHNNNFCVKIPEVFSNLTNLRVLNLRNNAFYGYVTPALGIVAKEIPSMLLWR